MFRFQLRRIDLIRIVVFAIVALILCFVPLFNVLGYESAAVFGVLGGIVACFIRPSGNSALDLIDLALRAMLAIAIPFCLLLLNALRVQNCDLVAGVEFWFYIAALSALFGATVSFVLHESIASIRIAKVVALVFVLATAAEFGLRLALEPPITGHHIFLGYFSGSIYDEALNVPRSLVYYRVLHACVAATIVAFFFARRSLERRALYGFSIVLVALSLFGYANRDQFGIDLTREAIAERLGGYVETEHFEIYYPAKEPFISNIERIKQDHEFRYAELQAFFETDPVEFRGSKVRSFVYENRNSKGAMMGGRRTQVAKIWLREIHILWRYYGDHMLAHELAHVFTEPFGNGPLRLSARYGVLGINMGVVEGAATAADWHAPEFDPHKASAALIQIGKANDLTKILSATGFWTQYSGIVYTLMGSFSKFLIDQHGIERFKDAYTDGDFERAYEEPIESLVQAWKAFLLQTETLSKRDLERARYRYDRKSIFQKVCARKVADLRVKADNLAKRREVEKAKTVYQQIVAFDPQNVEYRVEFARFLAKNDLNAEALAALKTTRDFDLGAVHSAQIEALRGDIEWKEEKLQSAELSYKRCLDFGLPNDFHRSVVVRSQALKGNEEERGLALAYLVKRTESGLAAYHPTEWVRRNPQHPIANYLLGRRLWQNRMWHQALIHLRKAEGRLGDATLEKENLRMIVECEFFDGEIERATQNSARLAASDDDHYRELGIEWQDRIAHQLGKTLKRH